MKPGQHRSTKELQKAAQQNFPEIQDVGAFERQAYQLDNLHFHAAEAPQATNVPDAEAVLQITLSCWPLQ